MPPPFSLSDEIFSPTLLLLLLLLLMWLLLLVEPGWMPSRQYGSLSPERNKALAVGPGTRQHKHMSSSLALRSKDVTLSYVHHERCGE